MKFPKLSEIAKYFKTPQGPKKPNPWLVMLGIFLVVFTLTNLFAPANEYTDVQLEDKGDGIREYSTVLAIVRDKDEVSKVIFGKDFWGNETVTIKRKGTLPITAGSPPGGWEEISQIAKSKGIEVDGTYRPAPKAKEAGKGELFTILLSSFGPVILILAVMIFL
jgi:hypothetical protein